MNSSGKNGGEEIKKGFSASKKQWVGRKGTFDSAGKGAVREPPLRVLAVGPLFSRPVAERTYDFMVRICP
jgi:hypothetical protein